MKREKGEKNERDQHFSSLKKTREWKQFTRTTIDCEPPFPPTRMLSPSRQTHLRHSLCSNKDNDRMNMYDV